MSAIAHTKNRRHGRTHDLVEHLTATSELAARFGETFGATEIARRVGLLHDVGKFHPNFQQYLNYRDSGKNWRHASLDHKMAGSLLALSEMDVIAMVIQAHHGGLRSETQFKSWMRRGDLKALAEDALVLAKEAIPHLMAASNVAVPEYVDNYRSLEFFLRFLFSSLVDADFLDTENHFHPEKSAVRSLSTELSINDLWRHFETDQARLLSTTLSQDSELNRLRENVYRDCVTAAEQPQGMFRLAVPTGSGKTRSVMGFALRHAGRHDLERVIISVPYISITEQTASVYRDIFEADGGTPVVLEHHTSADTFSRDDDTFNDQRLSAENWDARIVVTTTVQLFESLFSKRVSKARRVHNLAKSVIVLDEVQAIPGRLLEPVLDALRELCANYGSSVVLSTATQPAFDSIDVFNSVEAHDIVTDARGIYDSLKRVDYQWQTDRKVGWSGLATEIAKHPQVLCVMNTRRGAFDLLDALADPDAVHLSTAMCGAHRRDVIADVTRRLRAGEACRLVSTQVVEAGVDLDFPVVFRAIGPLDSIIQAAGRCNREGRLDRGTVVIFRPETDEVPAGQYRMATEITNAMRTEYGDAVTEPEACQEYFRRLFKTIDTDSEKIQQYRGKLDFPEVDRRFRMIEDDTATVVVTSYGSEQARSGLERDLENLRTGQGNSRLIMRLIQPYCVNVGQSMLKRLRQQSAIDEVTDGLWVWQGEYDQVMGIRL